MEGRFRVFRSLRASVIPDQRGDSLPTRRLPHAKDLTLIAVLLVGFLALTAASDGKLTLREVEFALYNAGRPKTKEDVTGL